MTDPTAAGGRRRRHRIVAVVALTLAAFLVVAGVVGVVVSLQTSQTVAAPLPTATSMNGKAVTLDPGDGTVFVAMHSLRNGAIGPGNYGIDVATGTPTIADGAAIEVGDVTYHVTQAERIAKTQLPHRSDVWADTPDRLVVITCLQDPQNVESAFNVVITATR